MMDTPIETISKTIDALAALRQAMTLNQPITNELIQKGVENCLWAGMLCVDLRYYKHTYIDPKVST